MKKILFTTNTPAPYRIDFFNELGKYCELTVLFEKYTSNERNTAWNKYQFNNFKGIFLKGINTGANNALCFSILKWLKDKSFDLIVIGGYSTPSGILSIEYLSFKKIKFILDFDGGIIKDDNIFMKSIKKHLFSKANYYTSTGYKTNEYLIHYGAKKEKIYLYPFTSLKNSDIIKKNISSSDKLRYREELQLTGNKIILSIGQFIHRKGFDVLINAVKNISNDISVYIIGGELINEYSDLIEKFKLNNIHFLSFKQKYILKKYYLACDLFVLPTREDIWGLVINEAMSYGLPVITTDKCIAGIELIENNINGYIIPVNDDKILSEKINTILSDDALRLNMGNASIDKISQYTIENMANRYMQIFEEILKQAH